jgi:hypothetical protein
MSILVNTHVARMTLFAMQYELIPVAARSKVQVCGRLVAGIANSNPADGMDVLSYIGRGLCDGLTECV